MDPPPSPPVAMGRSPPATAAADPPDDPLMAGPGTWWQIGKGGMFLRAIDGSPVFCPFECRDRLNANGTTTPRHIWMAEELEERAFQCEDRVTNHLRGGVNDLATVDYRLAAFALRRDLGAVEPAEEQQT